MVDVVHTHGAWYAKAVSLGPLAQILLGQKFWKLPEDQREALLSHERGHIAGHHLEKRLMCLLLAPFLYTWLCRRQELAADRYAAERGHAKALLTFLAVDHDEGWVHPSHTTRRKAIEQYEQTRPVPVMDSRLAGVTSQRN